MSSINHALGVARRFKRGGAVNTNPSMAQREAGNYKMRHYSFQGLPITIENPKGTIRKGIDHTGKKWASEMLDDYGYIKGTNGHDGDHVDVFIGPHKNSDRVFVIDQTHSYGKERFDEHKCMLGYKSKKKAFKIYKKSYGPSYGSRHRAVAITELSMDAFKEWLKGGGGKKPMAPDVPEMANGGKVNRPGVGDTSMEDLLYEQETEDFIDRMRNREYPPEAMYAAKGIAPNRDLMVEDPKYYQWYSPQNDWVKYPGNPPWTAGSFQDGGEVQYTEPTPEDPTRYPYYQAKPGAEGVTPGGEGMPTVAPEPKGERGPIGKMVEQLATPSQYPMEPTLQEFQMGETPEGFARNEAGELYRQDTGEVVPETRRPGVLPITRDPSGKLELAMPKMLDIAGYTMAPLAAPAVVARPGEAVLGSGMAKVAKIGTTPLDIAPSEISTFKQITGPLGTHPGGAYVDPTGQKWYIKNTPTLDHAKNEKLAAELYKLAGVPIGDVNLTQLNGKPAIATPWITGEQLNTFPEWQYPHIKGLQEHLPADVFTANYDSIGTGKNNIIVGPDDQAHRIDLGGALRYRAQGAPKKWWGPDVTEHKTMLDPKINMDASDVFGMQGYTDEMKNIIKEKQRGTAERIANITDNQINSLVYKYGPEGVEAKKKLADQIISRRDQVAKIYGGDKTSAPPTPPVTPYPKGAPVSGEKFPQKPLYWNEKTGQYQDVMPSTIKPMQINKTHEADQIMDAIKDQHASSVNPKLITPKQQAKIKQVFGAKDSDTIADVLYNSAYNASQKKNIMSWLDKDKQGEIEHIISHPKGLSQYDLDMLEYELKQQQELQAEANIHAGGEFTGQQYKSMTGKEFKVKGSPYHDAIEVKNPDWWKTFTPKEQKLFPKEQYDQTLLQKIKMLGFRPDIIFGHGSSHFHETGYPAVLKDPVQYKMGEKGFFTGLDPEVPAGYGSLIQKYIARPQKVGVADWHDLRLNTEGVEGKYGYVGYHMHELIEAARDKGVDLLIVNRIRDLAKYGNKIQSQYIFLNPAVLRAPTAKFDVSKLHLAQPLAGVVGGGLFSYGMLRGQEGKEGKMAKGGAVMPLKQGSSRATISQNIREFHTGKTYAHTKAKFGVEKARKQAIAVALSTARKSKKKAGGGGVDMESMLIRGSSYGLRHEGMINSSIPGRTDKLPMKVRSGSYILPADIPSALGQGNTMAGGEILKKMFSSGPYGLAPMRGGRGPNIPRLNLSAPKPPKGTFADGGGAEEDDGHVPIIAAGGEYIIHPDVVKDIGHGDIKAGHKVLDKFVLQVRKNNIKTLQKLPGPKQ